MRIKKPQLSIIENVKALTSKKFKVELEEILRDLRSSGYNSYWEVLNAKDYGIPQNRERIFIISIRKDLDNGRFKFPEPINLKLKLRDLLESNVNKKFYMPDEKYAEFLETFHMDSTDDFQQVGYINNYNGDANRVYSDSVARTLKAEEQKLDGISLAIKSVNLSQRNVGGLWDFPTKHLKRRNLRECQIPNYISKLAIPSW